MAAAKHESPPSCRRLTAERAAALMHGDDDPEKPTTTGVAGGAYEGDNYRSVLFENPGHGNHWITLSLEGVQSNRSAIGARIKVTVETPGGDRTIFKTVSTGGSFGCSPLRQEIGLDQAKSIRSIQIQWPNGNKTQELAGLELDRFYTIREGEARATALNLKTFKLPRVAAEHQHEHGQ